MGHRLLLFSRGTFPVSVEVQSASAVVNTVSWYLDYRKKVFRS